MIKNRGIAFKLTFFILASCTVIFVAIFGYNYAVSRRMLVRSIEENARNLALVTVNRIETVLSSVEKVPENLAYFLEQAPCDKEGIISLLRSVVENNAEIYGATIAFEPYACEKESLYFAPYFYKRDGEIKFTYVGGDSYRYFYWDWYQIPQELDRPVWSEPYYDEGAGNVIMSTYSVPFYKDVGGERKFMGIVTSDIYLSWLQEIVSSIKIGETGYGFLISGNGTVVTHPHEELIMNETIFSVAEIREDGRLREIGKDMIRGNSGFVPFESIVTGKKCWMVYAPVLSSGWSLGVLFPQAELMGDITRLNRTVFVLGVAGFLFLFAVIVLIASSITRPLRVLDRSTKNIASGDFDFELAAVKSGDEVGRLADSFVYMKGALKKYIKELTETTAAKERMESELRIARDIQMGIVPKKFPAFPERPEFDIYAVMEPAKEVGGDLYDYFFIDDRHLCFVIGDVSGKGVPAALFMAMTKTLIKATARDTGSPDEILDRVNRQICGDDISWMFVTVFCGILDTETGEVYYSSGGHNAPLVIREGGQTEFLSLNGGIVVGAMEDSSYTKAKLSLQPGDTIYMYTDGVTEAFNDKREMFSAERLKEEVRLCRQDTAEKLARETLQKVRSFTGKTPQSDDITILVLKYL